MGTVTQLSDFRTQRNASIPDLFYLPAVRALLDGPVTPEAILACAPHDRAVQGIAAELEASLASGASPEQRQAEFRFCAAVVGGALAEARQQGRLP